MPATCPYPEPARSSLYPHIPLPEGPSCLLPRLGLPSGLFPSGFPTKILYTPLLFPIHATCPTHLILFDLITQVEEYRSLSFSLYSFLHFPVISYLLGPKILLNTEFLNTLSLRSSHSVRDQVSLPYKTTGKIINLYILIFIFSCRKLEDKRFCTG